MVRCSLTIRDPRVELSGGGAKWGRLLVVGRQPEIPYVLGRGPLSPTLKAEGDESEARRSCNGSTTLVITIPQSSYSAQTKRSMRLNTVGESLLLDSH